MTQTNVTKMNRKISRTHCWFIPLSIGVILISLMEVLQTYLYYQKNAYKAVPTFVDAFQHVLDENSSLFKPFMNSMSIVCLGLSIIGCIAAITKQKCITIIFFIFYELKAMINLVSFGWLFVFLGVIHRDVARLLWCGIFFILQVYFMAVVTKFMRLVLQKAKTNDMQSISDDIAVMLRNSVQNPNMQIV